MKQVSIQQTFSDALDALIAQVKEDRSVLAAILCGSMAHDLVWAKSDIDLGLVTIDDRKVQASDGGIALDAGGVNVHAFLLSRTEFRQTVESAVRHSFIHSLLAKGRLLYTHDQTIADMFASLRELGQRDARLQLLHAATGVLAPLYKAHKWLVTRRDLDYSALWILYTATPLAQIEVISAGQLVDREVIPQAMKLNPGFFATIYTDLLNTPKTLQSVSAALDAVDRYIAKRGRTLFALVFDHLRDVGEARSCTEIEDYFARTHGLEGVTTACEYLADQGLIGKAATSRRLTRKSNVDVQELAFYHIAR